MKAIRPAIRTIAFLAVLALAIFTLQGPFGVDGVENFRRVRGFYSEKPNTLDGVYIGASNVHEFWQPAVGWMERGIAVYNLSTSALPMQGVEYLVREARRTQPDALYIFNLNTFKASQPTASVAGIHRVADYAPLTLNKIRFINAASEAAGLSWPERLELYLPIIRFHSRWSELSSWAYGNWDQQYKYFQQKKRFLYNVRDISGKYSVHDRRVALKDGVSKLFAEFLDYLDRERVNALFIKVPQVMIEDVVGRMNTLEDMVKQRGYPCLDLLDRIDEMGLDLHRDFLDKGHTNIHGSWKVSRYIADYLVENYRFTDKRGSSDYALWDRAAETFGGILGEHLLPSERAMAQKKPDSADGN